MIESDTIKLLRECDAGIKMGIKSIDDVLEYVGSQSLKKILVASKRHHELLLSRIETILNEASMLVQGIIDESANIIFGATIDDSMVDEVKITIIATGFAPNNIVKEEVGIKPAIKFNDSNFGATNDLPPLLREIEKEEVASAKVEQKPAIEQLSIETPIEEPVSPVVEQKKERELPAFMRKLFRK